MKNPEKWKKNHDRPFSVDMINEGSIDGGGPMRDIISNICEELTSSILPLLLPTANNLARVEPSMDCYKLNPDSKEPHMLEKFTHLGYFLGWSLRSKGSIAIDLPLCVWRRICQGRRNYVYTLKDLRELDVFRADMLLMIKQHGQELGSEEEFASYYDGYTFEVSLGDDKTIELCPCGSSIALTRDNSAEFVDLFLKHYTEQDAV